MSHYCVLKTRMTEVNALVMALADMDFKNVEVHATAANFVDLLVIGGQYQFCLFRAVLRFGIDRMERRQLGSLNRRESYYKNRLGIVKRGRRIEFERELIRARTGEGRERAKERGQSLGRPFKLTPHQRSEAIRRRDRGEPRGRPPVGSRDEPPSSRDIDRVGHAG